MGGLFSPGLTHVALIRKKRPAWQTGLWNLIGGHVEDESSLACMRREFQEETGYYQYNWDYVAKLHNHGNYIIDIFGAECYENMPDLKTTTDEIPAWVLADSLPYDTIPNIKWIVPFIKDFLSQSSIRSLNDQLAFGEFHYSF